MTLYDQNAQLWESTEVTVGEGTQEPETESFVSIDFWTMLFTLVLGGFFFLSRSRK